MNILIVCTSMKLPVSNYGGTERVVWYLAKELHRLKHHVWILAVKGSSCPYATIVHYNQNIPVSKQIPEGIDIIHWNGWVADDAAHIPHVVTQHGNYMMGKLDRNTVFVSRNHANRFGSSSFVYNGMSWEDYGTVDLDKNRTYYHFLGKAAWRIKNVRGAINTIKSIPNERLVVLGGYRFNFKMGLRFTFSPKISFAGMVGGERKKQLLNGSKGLIFPVLWDEPFGIAITESLYFGAPVFGTPYGSLPELIKPDVGYLTTSQSDLAMHLTHSYDYSPQICHEYACDLFNSKIMAEKYIEKYEHVLNGYFLNENCPEQIISPNKYIWTK